MIDLMDEKILKALIEALPGEITVIDANDKVIGWNRHNNRLFYRPIACIEMNFRECHPQKSLALVEKIIQEMKDKKRDKAQFWIDLPIDKEKNIKHKVLIEFYALRDEAGNYLGCMEHTLDVEDIMHLEGEKRLMDED